MQALHKVNKVLYEIVKKVIVVLLLLMAAFVFAQVLARYVFKTPLAWSEEITTYMFSWLAYIGAAAVTYKNDHVAITTLVDGMKNKQVQKVIRIITQLIIFAFYVLVCYESFHLACKFLAIDQRLTNLTSIKIGYIFMQVPLSALLMGLFTLERILHLCKDESQDLEAADAVPVIAEGQAVIQEGGND